MDVSRNCIFPELVGCDSSVSELISQLVGTSTWVKVSLYSVSQLISQLVGTSTWVKVSL